MARASLHVAPPITKSQIERLADAAEEAEEPDAPAALRARRLVAAG
mgnify:CR=1 FL=1